MQPRGFWGVDQRVLFENERIGGKLVVQNSAEILIKPVIRNDGVEQEATCYLQILLGRLWKAAWQISTTNAAEEMTLGAGG